MIKAKRDNNDAVLTFDITIPFWEERVFSFRFGCSSEAYAGLLAARASLLLSDRMKAIRQEAYEEGWKDAKARRARRAFFSGEL